MTFAEPGFFICSPTAFTSFAHLQHLAIYGICSPTAFAHLRHPVIYGVCSPTAFGHLRRLFTYGIRSPTAFAHLRHPVIYGICSLTASGHLRHLHTGHLRRLLTYGIWVTKRLKIVFSDFHCFENIVSQRLFSPIPSIPCA